MLQTLGIVQLPASPRLAELVSRRRLGDKPLLEWVVRRATECQRLDGVVAVVTPQQAQWVRDSIPADVPVHSSQRPDALGQFVEVLNQYTAGSGVRIAAEMPLIDPVLIDRLVSRAVEYPASDYIGYCRRDGCSAVHAPLGLFAEWFRARALRKAESEARWPADRAGVSAYVRAHPENYNLRFMPIPAELDRDDLRLSIDDDEDWEHVQSIVEALGPERLDWQHIAGLLDNQPGLRDRMAAMNRAAAEIVSGCSATG